jgi:hypothetical protein
LLARADGAVRGEAVKKLTARPRHLVCYAKEAFMDFVDAREMIHLRYELRRLLAEQRHDEARPLLARLRGLAESDAEERQALEPEIARWECSFAR